MTPPPYLAAATTPSAFVADPLFWLFVVAGLLAAASVVAGIVEALLRWRASRGDQ